MPKRLLGGSQCPAEIVGDALVQSADDRSRAAADGGDDEGRRPPKA
jgi:hypothetical protein